MRLIYFATKRECDIPLFVDAENSTAVELESHYSHGFPFSMRNPLTAIYCLVQAVRKPYQ